MDEKIRRLIRRSELRKMIPLADSTIYDLEAAGKFPKRFALTPRCVVWYLDEVEAWIERRYSGQTQVEATQPPKAQSALRGKR